MKEHYRDRRGIAYADRHTLVSLCAADWPKYPPRVRRDTHGEQRAFHGRFRVARCCWLCGVAQATDCSRQHELHHLAAGSRGRSHERELFTYLCKECHQNITPDDLGKLLWAKWEFDHEYCDWEFLTIRHGHRLPDLEIPSWIDI